MTRNQFECIRGGSKFQLTPDGEQGLEDEPHGDPVEDGSETHRLGQVEGSKDGLYHQLQTDNNTESQLTQ